VSLWDRLRKAEQELAGSRKHARELEQLIKQLQGAVRHVDHAHPLPRWGVDYSFDRPVPAALRQAGTTFAVRYLTGAGKALTHLEAENLSAAGIDVVGVFESTGGRARGGYDAGAADARTAVRALHTASGGHADGRPIYFACDFDAAGEGEHVLGQVMEYVRGAVHAIGWHRVGLYAGLGPIERAHHLNRCRYLWQTLAWSGGRWSAHAQLRQTQVDRLVAGAHVDIDLAVAPDFGQWRT
jgi:hypothetical protein